MFDALKLSLVRLRRTLRSRLTSGICEIREVAVAILRVTLSCPFLEDDFHGGASIFAQHLVHGRRRSRAECDSSLAEAPRSDDQEKQQRRYRERDVAFCQRPSLVRL